MTELSEKDLNAIAEHVEEMTELDGIDNYDVVKAYHVENLLIQKDVEHKAEIEKLKELHRESVAKWRDAFEKMHQRAMKSESDNTYAELKANQEKLVWITREEMKGYSDTQQALMGQSLAQHDKQVKVEVLDRLLHWGAEQTYNNWIVNPMNNVQRPPVQSIRNNGYGIQSSQIESYINQIKEEK